MMEIKGRIQLLQSTSIGASAKFSYFFGFGFKCELLQAVLPASHSPDPGGRYSTFMPQTLEPIVTCVCVPFLYPPLDRKPNMKRDVSWSLPCSQYVVQGLAHCAPK